MRTVLTVQSIAFGAIFTLAVSLGGCASTLQFAADTFGVDVVSTSVQQKAYKAASVSFVAWEAIQDGVKKTGRLPRCSDTVKLLCVTDDAWHRIQDIELKTSATLQAAKPLIAAGTDDVTLLMSIPDAVADAQAAINAETPR